jgi:hypothetical protein
VHGDPKLSPWIDTADVDRRGAVLVWETNVDPPILPDAQRKTFPRAELRGVLTLPRQTLHPLRPAMIAYAFVPPRP